MSKKGVSFGESATNSSDRSIDPQAKISSIQNASPASSFRSKVLRSNLTRSHMNRDPIFYYEVQKVLGVGSMGSVVKVRKRDEVVGGSARKSLQGAFRQEKIAQECMRIPGCGWFVDHCLWNPLSNHGQTASSRGSVRNLVHSITGGGSPFKAVNDSGRSLESLKSNGTLETPTKAAYNLEYAMKSIHLSRVTDKTFVEELRNEIAVLKALDHPHIGPSVLLSDSLVGLP